MHQLLLTRLAESSVPPWVEPVSNWLADLPIAFAVAAFLLLLIPVSKPPWVIETGLWIGAVGAILLMLGLVGLIVRWNPVVGLLVALALTAYCVYLVPASHRSLAADTEGTIPAPPDRVFALAIDPAAHSRLMPGMIESHVKGGGPLRAGAVIAGTFRMLGARILGEDMLLEYDPPRRYTERTLGVPINQVTVTFDPNGGGTRVRCQYRGVMSYPRAMLGGWLTRRRTEQSLRRFRTAWLEAIQGEITRAALPSA